jgi:hypothetical protein
MIYAYLALSILLAVALITRLAWPRLARTLGRIPSDDKAAIDLFLANRDEAAVTIKKEILRGGFEGRFGEANIYGVPNRGRFYAVLASDADGRRYRHTLAVAGDRGRHDSTLLQQGPEGYWTRVLQ